MTLEDESYVLPADLHIKWKPFWRPEVLVEAPGYRTLAFRLSRRHVWARAALSRLLRRGKRCLRRRER